LLWSERAADDWKLKSEGGYDRVKKDEKSKDGQKKRRGGKQIRK